MKKFLFIVCIAIALMPLTATAQMAPASYRLLPFEGGVGVQKQLRMVVKEFHADRTGELCEVGEPASIIKIRWSSSNTTIASINQQGIVTGRKKGIATITATLNFLVRHPMSLHSKIKVGTPVASLLGPDTISIPQYCTRPIEVESLDREGRNIMDRPVTWGTGTQQIASIQPLSIINVRCPVLAADEANPDLRAAEDAVFFHRTAQVLGREVGQTLVNAECEHVLKKISVTVTPSAPTVLQLRPDPLVLDVQVTGHADMVGYNQQGCRVSDMLSLTTATWETADPSVAIVNQNTGEVRGLRSGTTILTARTQSGLIASTHVIIPAVSSLILTPSGISDLEIGAQNARQITAGPRSATNSALANRTVTWRTSDANTVSVQPSSLYTATVIGNAAGVANVIASSELVTACAPVAVVQCEPGGSAHLDVPLYSQQTPDWCWAASGEMIMAYLGKDVSQCEQANNEFNQTNCCDSGGGTCSAEGLITYWWRRPDCMQGGYPQFDKYGFDSQYTRIGDALSWDDLKKQLSDTPHCKGAPVAFSWHWDGGGSDDNHMMVARGYYSGYNNGENYVEINNPLDTCFGDSSLITYDDYVASPGSHTHNQDYYDIKRRP